ncbi:MAG TPA: ATP-binding protein, partial [Myxococcota bacterium]|nr:ATP-binding protein [Myxococcota bacterium]
AHDFNNLLAVILGNLELLDAEGLNDAHAAEWVKTAIAAAERGASLTQRLLAFSRKQALRPAAVDANALVQGMLELLRRTLGEGIEIELVRDAGLWPCLVDRNQLENAILNLAINARDAMPNGGKLTISTSNARIDEEVVHAEPDVEPGAFVVIAVSDTGAGMSEEVRQHAFEPFFTTKDLGRGSGLGLSMVYGFTKQSGGHASVSSESGLGTTVRLYLPRYSGEKLGEAPELDGTEPAQPTGERILVVEDNAELRALVARMLRSLGYRVLEASAGVPALEIIRSSEIDLLLSDVVLPEGMSGSELVEQARRARPSLRALHMSGYAEDAIVHHGRLADGEPFLQKPFRKIDVARAVRKALDRGRSQR